MTDETGAAGTQADPAAQPQAGDPESQADKGPEQPATETMSLDEARKLRAEANSLRKRLKEAEERDLTEAQRSQKELDDLRKARDGWETERREMQLQMHVADTATRLAFVNPTVAYRLIDRDAVEYDDNGTPRNTEKLLQKLAESEPYLVTPVSPAGSWGAGTGRPSNSDADMNAQIRRAAGRA